jgi:hypothetical protein
MHTGHALAAAALLLAAASAQAQAPAPQPIQPLQRAKVCTPTVNRFGHFGKTFVDPKAAIDMANDGGWCWAQFKFGRSNGLGQSVASVPEMAVLTPPAHGSVLIGMVDEAARFAYRPQPGFTGTDSFHVSAKTPFDSYDIPFTVTVTN